jgi:hypothetical protein
MDYDSLKTLKRIHPGWRLLTADNAPMIVSFLYRCFIEPNVRTLQETDLVSSLDDYLYRLNETHEAAAYPKSASEYLNDWSADERAWLRKYYPRDSDEPHYDLTPATENAIRWLAGLQQPHFIGAESRLMTIIDLLRQIMQGTETDPEVRIFELERRKSAIESEIQDIRDGKMSFMGETPLRERFFQVADTARELLADFRQVEQNFRDLDRQVREKVTAWDGSKGEMLEDFFGERDAITDTDQGHSFRAFWDFLMSPARQEELSQLLERVMALESIQTLSPDKRLTRVHYDWLEAGEVAQRTVARLSEQLRRYLDDKALLENRRIMNLLREIEQHALSIRDVITDAPEMEIDELAPNIELPMERTLFSPPIKPRIDQQQLSVGDDDIDAQVLFEQIYVDRNKLEMRIRQALQMREQISLTDLVNEYPLQLGLAELVAYLSLAADDDHAVIDDTVEQSIQWTDSAGDRRRAFLPLVIFSR